MSPGQIAVVIAIPITGAAIGLALSRLGYAPWQQEEICWTAPGMVGYDPSGAGKIVAAIFKVIVSVILAL
jgi:hypothetical protein